MNTLIVRNERGTESAPDTQAETFEHLSRAKQDLASALEKLHAQRQEIESNEKRLAEAQKDEQELLAAEIEEVDQVGRLSQIVALQRLLGSRIESGRNRLESAKEELQRATAKALDRFQRALAALLDSRNAENLARLKKLVPADKWMWAETHAKAFIRYASDVIPLDMLGDQAAAMLRGGAVQKAAEHLLMDIAKLETEAAG